MLIDLLPEPGPGPRPPAAASRRGEGSPDTALAFGAVLSRLDRVAPRGEEALAEASPAPDDAEEAAQGAALDPGTATEAEGEETTPVPGLQVAEEKAGKAVPAADSARNSGRIAVHSDERPAAPVSGRTAAADTPPAESAPPDGDRSRATEPAARERFERLAPLRGDDRPGMPEAARAPVASARSAIAPATLEDAAPPHDQRTAESRLHGRTRLPVEDRAAPSASESARWSAERAVAAPPIPPAAAETRLSAFRFAGLRLSDASFPRALDGFASALALGAGEGSAPPGPGEIAAERLLRPASAATAELAREVAQQIGARITPLARGQFELMLSPAELGRLEIALREINGVMTLTVSAERPETLELIRRHVDLLAQELSQIAQRELALQLGAGGSGGQSGDPRSGAGTSSATTGAESVSGVSDPAAAPTAIGSDRLDIRL